MRIPFGRGPASKAPALFLCELGTCGVRLSERWYADVFFRWGGQRITDRVRLGVFVHDGIFRRWYALSLAEGCVLTKVEVLDAPNAARIFRREMRPYALLQHRSSGHQYEAMSYPCPEPDNTVTIMARTTPEDPSTLTEFLCSEFEFTSWSGLTGIPACDPLPRKEVRHDDVH